MADAFLGQIMLFGGGYAPRDWALCQGQLLPIAQNQALYSLLSTTYGGDGSVNFALPDMRGRVPLHMGSGPGLSNRLLGQKLGAEWVTLDSDSMPSHLHALEASLADATTNSPLNTVLAKSSLDIYSSETPDKPLSKSAIGTTGGSQPHYNMMPFLCVCFCICIQGQYPSRN